MYIVIVVWLYNHKYCIITTDLYTKRQKRYLIFEGEIINEGINFNFVSWKLKVL